MMIKNANIEGELCNSPLSEGFPQGGVSEFSPIATKLDFYLINNIKIPHTPITPPYNPHLKIRAKALRKARNLPEVILDASNKKWSHNIDFADSE